MARYIKDFQISVDPQHVQSSLNQYLQSEGYEYINHNGENVFKRGNGVWENPTFFKFSCADNMVRIETWMQYVFAPGVYGDELGLDEFTGSRVKRAWEKRIKNIEALLNNFAAQAPYHSPAHVFCNSCGNQFPETAQSCPVCGQKRPEVNGSLVTSNDPVTFPQSIPQTNNFVSNETPLPPAGYPVSRKEFINKYVQPSLRKSITSIAILCYICAGLTFVVSCLSNSWGIIDALILAGLALGMQLAKSKVCAILILILSIVEVLLSLVSGSFPFWWLIAGVSAAITFHKIEKQYKEFMKR